MIDNKAAAAVAAETACLGHITLHFIRTPMPPCGRQAAA